MTESADMQPDVIVIMTDEERAAPTYESQDLTDWRRSTLAAERWFTDNAVNFARHYTGSLACVPSRPTIFTGQYPDVHGVTQTDGLGKMADDSRLRWLPEGEVPTLGHWFREAGYDTQYRGKWHISHADLHGDSGEVLRTNDSAGNVLERGVEAYRRANPLDAYGFDGWVGPEPHGGAMANCGLRRDPLIAEQCTRWLADRYTRRAAGDAEALRPFLLVASFVNPHDIVLFPAWVRSGSPVESPSPLDPPTVAPSPTDDEDLRGKPAAQIAYRESYPTGYGLAAAVSRAYKRNLQQYRDLYYRLHAEVDGPLDLVRRTVTNSGHDAVIVRTADHGDLLGSHGGLHQKWFTLYDEATRVPFSITRVGSNPTVGATVTDAPTSHVDIVPTLLGAAGIDEAIVGARLRQRFSEVHPLPGRNLMPVVAAPAQADRDRAVYLMTRDNMLEGDSGASAMARRFGREKNPPTPLKIQVAAHVGSNFEGVVNRVSEVDAVGGGGQLWKLVRTFDDPDTWTQPGQRHLAATGPSGESYRTEPLPDEWELYNLDDDPIEAVNRWRDPASVAVFDHLQKVLNSERHRSIAKRNEPWPYVERVASTGPASVKPRPPALLARRALQRLGLHPEDDSTFVSESLVGRRALVVCTNHGWLEIGKPTGVFASEMTVPYYAFDDAGMSVDLASPLGGLVPVDPQSLRPPVRCAADDRFLADETFRSKVDTSRAVGDLVIDEYDIVYLAGGWGAAFDFATSMPLATQITRANELNRVIGGVCHGPLGLCGAKAADGSDLVNGRRVTAVTDKQVRELGIESTPKHPETELRRAGALFESATRFRDPLANHWVVDGNLITGQNQNAAPMVAREMLQLAAANLKVVAL